MSAHTPGPWNTVNTRPTDALDLVVVFDADSQCVCSVPKGSSNKPQQERRANARLIAAAPDLLEALQSTYDALCISYPLHSIDNDKRFGILSQARAAIAKATGAQS